MRRLGRWLRVLFQGDRFRRELEEEMRVHREMIAEEERESGAPHGEASRKAVLRLGNAASLGDASREAWGLGPVDRLWQDLCYAARLMRRTPGFTATVVLVLALGIGANTATFSGLNALLLNPFPFRGGDRIVLMEARHVSGGGGAGYADFLDWRAQNTVFEEMAIFPWSGEYTLTGEGDPQRTTGSRTTYGLQRVLGIEPALGRFFSAEEDQPGAPRVAVLSYAGWQRRYGGSPEVLGRTVTLDGAAHTIIGVLPERFSLPGARTSDFWMPLREGNRDFRLQHQYGVLARLKPGISMERAQADMTAIASRLEKEYPATNTGWRVTVASPRTLILNMAGRPILILASAVFFVLLLACANVAGMLLSRGTARVQEMSVRASLGAGRGRLMRQVLTESVLLALAGGALGLAVAKWLMDLARAVSPAEFAFDNSLRLNWQALAFTLALSVATGIGFGIAPAWCTSRTDLAGTLKGSARGGGRARSRLLSAIVASEVALSMVLLVAAGLLAKDLAVIIQASTGIRMDHLIAFALDPAGPRYRAAAETARFYDKLLARLRAAPGVEAAGAVDTLPMTGTWSGGPFEIEGRAKPADWMEVTSQYLSCTPGYFRAMGIPMLAGRDFEAQDTAGSLPVAIVSEPLARRYFPGQNPVGRRINRGGWRTIVGIAAPVKRFNRSKAAEPQIFVPVAQTEAGSLWITVRTSDDPLRAMKLARDAVRELDPQLPVLRLGTMRDVQRRSMSDERLMTSYLAGFAGFAVVIAAIGIYGVIAWSVSRRTYEIGVRLALGASYGGIVGMIVRKGLLLALLGLVAGLPLAMGGAKALSALLYGVSPRDAGVYALVAAVLALAAAAASLVPAHRAARLGPEAIRAAVGG